MAFGFGVSMSLLGRIGLFESQCVLKTGHSEVKFGGSILLELSLR